MKTTLPERSKIHEKQINKIAKIILDNFEDHISYLILFGSFARGDWTFDSYTENHARFEYASDFDFLIITRTNKQGTLHAASRLQDRIENKLDQYTKFMQHTPHFVIEAPSTINKKLKYGKYFYSDIIKEGICLYDNGKIKLEKAKILTQEEIKQEATDYYEQWFVSADGFLKGVFFYIEEKKYNIAAFMLHQTTEHFLNCTLLVLTGYAPKTHDIKELLGFCASQNNEFLKIFPKGDKENEKSFTLLRTAYIDARYSMDYKITKKQLEYLMARIKYLKDIVQNICLERISQL